MTNDPKGYYKILGVRVSANKNDIKKAFREKAHELHPDKNKERNTTKEFQFLSEAYEVLIDSDNRAQYDSSGITAENNSNNNGPVKCSSCEKATAQPRYVMFYEVKSFIFVTFRNITQGIFCADCAQKKVMKPTLITWLLGWWGFPYGPIYTVQALAINLVGGKKPKKINADILSYQAWYFAQQNNLDIANSIADEALRYSTEQKQKSELNDFKKSIYKYNGEKGFKKLKDKWKFFSKSFLIQSILILFVFVVIMTVIAINTYVANQESKAIRVQAQYEAKIEQEINRVYNLNHPVKPLPKNGKVFKNGRLAQLNIFKDKEFQALDLERKRTTVQNYFKRELVDEEFYELAQDEQKKIIDNFVNAQIDFYVSDILAPFRITTRGRGHHLIKMVDHNTGLTKLKVFIREGQTVDTELPLGKYKMKYAVGNKWYGEKDKFGEKETIYSQSDKALVFRTQGNQIIGHTVELFLQANGNLKTRTISSNEF